MDLIPFAWPAEWSDPSALEILKGTPINCVLVEDRQKSAPVAARGEQQGLQVLEVKTLPSSVHLIKGAWPGIRLSREKNTAEGGPTGAPWVDSNGWAVQLARVQAPGKTYWVSAEPEKDQVVRPNTHLVAVADAAACGGRWIVNLAGETRQGAARRDAAALDLVRRIGAVISFFGAHRDWSTYEPHGVLGVVSDFTGDNEFMSTEVLNLTARQNQPYKILLKDRVRPASLAGLVAVIYPDDQAPSPELRKRLLAFVGAGGLLVTGPKWGAAAGEPAGGYPHPRFKVVRHGKGRIAVGSEFDDPFVISSDARILMSHRHDLIRFWNSGNLCAFFLMAPGGKRAVVHMINYATSTGRDSMSCRIAGPWRSARLWMFDQPGPITLETVREPGGIQVHLPPIPVHGAVDLVA
ncbi:MAG: hypothetical protein IT158_13705 [Bryobacterales bacterium]|nr:hypothetical protein [Bryobacterales bacterium]